MKKIILILTILACCVVVADARAGNDKYEIFEDEDYSFTVEKEIDLKGIVTIDPDSFDQNDIYDNARAAYRIGPMGNPDSLLVVSVYKPKTSEERYDCISMFKSFVMGELEKGTKEPDIQLSSDKIDGKKYKYFEVEGKSKGKDASWYIQCVFIEHNDVWVYTFLLDTLEFHNRKGKEAKHLRKGMKEIISSFESTSGTSKKEYDVFVDLVYPYRMKKDKSLMQITQFNTKELKEKSYPDNARVSYIIGNDASPESILALFVHKRWSTENKMAEIRSIQKIVEGFFVDYKMEPKIKTSKDRIGGKKYYYFDLVGMWKVIGKEVYAKCMIVENEDIWILMLHCESLEFAKKKDGETLKLRKEMHRIVHSYESTRPKK